MTDEEIFAELARLEGWELPTKPDWSWRRLANRVTQMDESPYDRTWSRDPARCFTKADWYDFELELWDDDYLPAPVWNEQSRNCDFGWLRGEEVEVQHPNREVAIALAVIAKRKAEHG